MKLTSGKDQQRKVHDGVGYLADLLREIYSEPLMDPRATENFH